jgi:4-amino-4-deoxy-L-arabinose transferase-like glycosyltransferase
MRAKFLTWFLLGTIIALALFLRIYKIGQSPPSLNWDETSIGYNAYSILKTGRDEWGQKLPLHFRSYGEYKLPVQIYASIPAIAVFGLNDFGVRITPVIYGTLSVLVLYFLAKELTKNKWMGLLSAFLLAISPWHIQLTRASFETSFSALWILLGIWFFLKGFKNSKWWIAATIPFAVSVYTYNSARIIAPLLVLTLLIIYRKDVWREKKNIIISGVLFVLLLLPLAPFVFKGGLSARYRLVSITDEKGLVPRIEERRNNSTLPESVKRLIHNRYSYIGFYFAKNYLAHFDPNFLFIKGAGHVQHNVQGIGELYAIQAPFVLVGLWLFLKKKYPFRGLALSWLLLTFVPVALTQDSIPNALRTVIAAPLYQIFTAVGFCAALSFIKNKKLRTVIVIFTVAALFWGLIVFTKQLFSVYPNKYSREWQYGNRQVVTFIKDHYKDYDLIVYTRSYGEPHMFTLFYLGWDPAKYQNDKSLVRFETYDWVRVLRFDKFYFPDLGDIGTRYQDIVKENAGKKILFIGKPGDFPAGTNILDKVNFLDGSEAFEITEIK